MTVMQKRELISPGYPDLSVSEQCKLIGLQRSSYYFKPKGESLLVSALPTTYLNFAPSPYSSGGRVRRASCD